MKQADIGVIGLSVMGANLARNLESRGYTVAVFNRTSAKTDEFVKAQSGKNFSSATELAEFVKLLATPRKILMMVKAGEAVDELIDQLLPLIENGDVLIDGGNSYFLDTERRVKKVETAGKLFVGMGVSGGEEGALHGPALMPGGSKAAWPIIQPLCEAIAAKVGEQEEPCCSWVGENGAGHFVKMVHNGIEYADMQLISESYSMMRDSLNMSPTEIQHVFEEWNKGPLQSYLIEITAKILAKKDTEKDGFLVDAISDAAAQKGTGKWTAQVALDLGVPIPTIAEAVNARLISSLRNERQAAQSLLQTSPEKFAGDRDQTLKEVEAALYASKVIAYAQGFALMKTAASEYAWKLDMAAIAASWRGGCIIRAELLTKIMEAYQANDPAANLMVTPLFREELIERYGRWKKAVIQGIQSNLALPGFTSALAYFEAYRNPSLPTNLIQAQRDFFGAHTYERIDKEGHFHTEWES